MLAPHPRQQTVAARCPEQPFVDRLPNQGQVPEPTVSERSHQIEEHDPDQVLTRSGIQMSAEGGIFAWRGDEVVLLAQHTPEAFVLARGWAYGDRLVDIRRWSFSEASGLVGQVRRLAREATGNHHIATEAAGAALAWAHDQVDEQP